MPQRVLILDPHDRHASLAQAVADACGEAATVARETTDEAALGCDLLLVDEADGDGSRDGAAVVEELRARGCEAVVVIVADAGDVGRASAAVKAGADDFLVRGGELGKRVRTLLAKARRMVALLEENRRLRAADRDRWAVVGDTAVIAAMMDVVERVAPVPRPVLIIGERGSGKELVARAIHAASERKGPFVALNCAAFNDALLDAELFGHERGAYTGADARAIGKLELAQGGTLFLDEVGNMSLAFQRKLLRAIEYKTFLRVGGTRDVTFDARVVAATNADLRAHIEGGAFLADLHDRLAFETIRVPPLRERRDDIAGLANHFLRRFVAEVPRYEGATLAEDALEAMRDYAFPGNVRELKNLVERAIYRGDGGVLHAENLDLVESPARSAESGSFGERVQAFEQQLIDEALDAARGNQTEAARALGLKVHQLRYLVKKRK